MCSLDLRETLLHGKSGLRAMSVYVALWLRAVLVAVLVARGSMQMHGKCIINFVCGCRLQPGYGAVHDDNAAAYTDFGVGASAERCLARSKEYFEWCGNNDNTQQIRWQPSLTTATLLVRTRSRSALRSGQVRKVGLKIEKNESIM